MLEYQITNIGWGTPGYYVHKHNRIEIHFQRNDRLSANQRRPVNKTIVYDIDIVTQLLIVILASETVDFEN